MTFNKVNPDSKQSECGMYWVKRIPMQGQFSYESWAAGSRLGSFHTVREAQSVCQAHQHRGISA